MSKTFKTPKGTELPLIELKGKLYLEVKYRLVWFREERPIIEGQRSWAIVIDVKVNNNGDAAVAKATIIDPQGNIVQTATKMETQDGFPDFLEKAETGAVGRALAMIGYGTQFAMELEEGDRIVDAPCGKQVPHTASPIQPKDSYKPQPKVDQSACKHPKFYPSKFNQNEEYCPVCKIKRAKSAPPPGPIADPFFDEGPMNFDQGAAG